jgi:disulfide bond formation protein DsbB
MIAAICAYLLGLRRWAPDHDRLVTMVEWQGGPQQSWIPLYKPETHEYEPHHISNEIVLFVGALLIACWGYKNRHHKVDRIFTRGVLALCAAGALYLMMLWLGRQHVEGDWTAVPPRLIKYQVDTPEFLAKEAAWMAEWDAADFKRTGLTPAQKEKHQSKMAFLGSFFFAFMVMCFVKAALEQNEQEEEKKRR